MSVRAPPRQVVAAFSNVFRHFIPRAELLVREFPGQPTSWYRDQRDNQRVGGSTFSQHLLGFAFDIVLDDGERAPDFVELARRLGMIAVVEQDHVHVQFFPAGILSDR